jgi:DNA polymerase-3 subunit delta'
MHIVDSERVKEELRHGRRTGRVHGAYLFEGPQGTGKRATALWFARLLLCRGDADDPCEACPDCTRSQSRDGVSQHADLMIIEPDGAEILVGQIREMQSRLGLVANEGGRRVVLILDAERLRLGSANALLKTLEEPPTATSIILCATAAATLPITIRSRSTLLRFGRQAESAVADALRESGFSDADATLTAALGGGSVAAATSWADEFLEDAREMRAAIEGASRDSASALMDFAEGFRGGGGGPGAAARTRTRAQLLLAVHAAISRASVERAAREGDANGLARWLDRADAGARAPRELVRRNLNPQLVVEGLLLGLRDGG